VKVRGYRIELGEVEGALREQAGVRDVVVVAREEESGAEAGGAGGGGKRLIAYIVSEQGERTEEVSNSELREYLRERLPDYMVPSVFVRLKELPLTANGKVNRKALPAPEVRREERGEDYAAPRTAVEEVVAGIYSQVLKVEEVGVHDNFFEMGGHSLLATQLISRVRGVLGVDVSLRSVFAYPTVGGLASQIEAHQQGVRERVIPRLERVRREGGMRLSFAQERLWFVDQLEPNNVAYNVPLAIRLRAELKKEALEQSINEMVARHEVLRTSIKVVDGQPVQIIAPAAALSLPFIDLTDLPEAEREAEARRLASLEAQRPFNLSSGPLLRACLVRLGGEEYLLMLTMHHIVSDGWSMGVLFRELTVLYEAYSRGAGSPLAELPIQYADYAAWQREWMSGEVLEEQLAYWRRQLAGAPTVLKLPSDRPRPAVQSLQGASRTYLLSNELARELKQLSKRESVTLFMLLLAGFQTLLHRYSKQEDIVVGTDIANRNRSEIENLIGFFVNILVLRTDLSGNPSFRQLLARVRETALGAYMHQDLPFEKLVRELQPNRSLGQRPLFEVLFVVQNAPLPALELTSIELRMVELEDTAAKFDLAVFAEETAAGLLWKWNYSTELFDASTIDRMAGHFETLLQSIVARPDAKLAELEMLGEAERLQQAEEERRLEEKSLKKFKSIKPRAVKMPKREVIKTGFLNEGETMPLVLRPALSEVDLSDWAGNNRSFIQTKLREHGALLFRDFNLNSSAGFERFASAICPDLFTEYGDLPREKMGDKVYLSTPYPSDLPILFHNESSHLGRWPMNIWFYCVKPAEQGGETPIVDCRRVYALLSPRTRERFEQQLMYVRTYTRGLDVSWEEFFRTTSRAEVEEQCRRGGMDWEWLADDELRTRKVTTAISQHPQTGETVFFNQVQLHHASCLEPSVRASLLKLFGEERLPRNVYYGDGSRIEDEVMEEVAEAYRRATVSFAWQKGDVLMLDNMLTAHGRNRYVGERKILVAMGEMFESERSHGSEQAGPLSFSSLLPDGLAVQNV